MRGSSSPPASPWESGPIAEDRHACPDSETTRPADEYDRRRHLGIGAPIAALTRKRPCKLHIPSASASTNAWIEDEDDRKQPLLNRKSDDTNPHQRVSDRSKSSLSMRDLEHSYEYLPLAATCESIKLPVARVLDRQGFGAELYRGPQGQVLRTATDLLPFRVNKWRRDSMPNGLAQFYSQQNQEIADMLLMERHIHNVTADVREEKLGDPVANYHLTILPLDADATRSEDVIVAEEFWQQQIPVAVTICTFLNLFLAGLNIYVSFATGSLSVVTSTVDTILDLVTSSILNFTSHSMKDRDPYTYPGGKSRMEPIGILLFAVIMGMAALSIVAESIERLTIGFKSAEPISHGPQPSQLSLYAIVYGINIATKFCAIFVCRFVSKRLATGSNSLETLLVDQSYDAITYTGAFASAAISGAFPSMWFLDPSTAILLSWYIGFSWISQAREHIQQLVGKSADRRFLNQLTYLALRHDARIKFIDQVQAYHFGERLLVEVHIGLPDTMPLRESHDIGESLQIKIEALEQVEIAHVHTDFEYCHQHPEHKTVS